MGILERLEYWRVVVRFETAALVCRWRGHEVHHPASFDQAYCGRCGERGVGA